MENLRKKAEVEVTEEELSSVVLGSVSETRGSNRRTCTIMEKGLVERSTAILLKRVYI